MSVTRKWLVAPDSTISQSLILFLLMMIVEKSALASWVTFAVGQGVGEVEVIQSEYV